VKRHSLLIKLYVSYLSVILLALLALALLSSKSFTNFYHDETAAQLTIQAQVLIAPVQKLLLQQQQPTAVNDLVNELYGQTPTRVTVILPDGKVIADTHEALPQINNHRDRPEISWAMTHGRGMNQRYSNTLRQRLMYVALPITADDQVLAVVRTALPLTAIEATLIQLRQRIFAAAMAIIVLVTILTFLLSRHIARPLADLRQSAERFADGDFQQQIPSFATLEINSLANSMNQMAQQLQRRFATITAQNAQIRGILSSMVEGVIAIDMQTKIISINDAAAAMLAITPGHALDSLLVEVIRRPALEQILQRALVSDTMVEGELVLHNNGDQFIQVHATLLHDNDANRAGIVIVLNDLTRIRRLENLRRDFVANVSHELRTPITAIKGFVETLLEEELDSPPQARRFLEIILRQSNRLNAIIEDLLLLSRLERNDSRDTLNRQRTLLKPVLDNAVQLCADHARDRQISVIVHCDANLRANLNPLLLEQALINLINNAVTYSNGPSDVHVRATADSGFVRLHVQDFGIGIPAAEQERLFERFYRVDKARSRKVGGTGLGLAIVKHIVQAHGGEVSVASVVGKGTTFAMHLPQ